MSELEPKDSRVVHGNAKPEQGDERFAEKPTQANQFDRAQQSLDDRPDADAADGERGAQQERSVDNDQFEASDLDHGEAQYQADPLVRQQVQQNEWDDQTREDAADDFETGQADYGSAGAKRQKQSQGQSQSQSQSQSGSDKPKGDLNDDNLEDVAPKQARTDRDNPGT